MADGHALVADFGIARALLSDAASAERLTATGLAVGTPGYMSPEQATGDGGADGRTDVYALGAVCHEMLAGEPPFRGPSAQAILSRVLTESPPSLTQLRRGIAPHISVAVQKALASEPADRFGSASEFAKALDETLAIATAPSGPLRARLTWLVVAVALLVMGSVWSWRVRTTATGGNSGAEVRIAVLPFGESGAGGNSSFTSGLAEALRGDLATLPNVAVVAGASISALGDSVRSPRYVAQQLRATHVLSGTVQWNRTESGGVRVRVVPELIDFTTGDETAGTGSAIEDRLDDLFQVQARVSTQIASSLGVSVSATAASRLAKAPTTNPIAYEEYLRARLNEDELIPHLQRAVSLDSNFALAWAELGVAAGLSYQSTFDPAVAELSRRASARALALDSSSARALLSMALYERHVVRNFLAALDYGRAAMQRAPGNADLMHFTAAVLFNARRFDQALALAKRGADLDPRNADALARVALIEVWRRDYPAAEIASGRANIAARHRISHITFDSALLPLMRGDVPATRAYINSLPDSSVQAAQAAFLLREWLMGWPLDARLLAMGLSAVRRRGSAAHYYVMAADEAWRLHDRRAQLAFADSAIVAAREQLRGIPGEERLRLVLAFAHVFAGNFREAIAQADSANATRSAWQDGFIGVGVSVGTAEVLAMSGATDRSIALIDSLLGVPGFLTPAWLRIDPHFNALRNDPRFRALSEQQ